MYLGTEFRIPMYAPPEECPLGADARDSRSLAAELHEPWRHSILANMRVLGRSSCLGLDDSQRSTFNALQVRDYIQMRLNYHHD